MPFLQLADGGGVAFWNDGEHQRIAIYDSEGGQAVIAVDFREFLIRLGSPADEFRERIELDADVDTSGLVAPTKLEAVPAALNRKLTAWIESHTLNAPKLESDAGEKVRRKLVAIAEVIELLPALLPLMKSRRTRYSLGIMKSGEVFGDRGNELALEP